MLYRQGGRRGEPVLVIARRQVMARLHALDRMAELAPAGLDRASYNYQQRPGHSLPPAAKNRLRRRIAHLSEALHATQVMDAVHQQDLTVRAAAPNIPSALLPRPATRPTNLTDA